MRDFINIVKSASRIDKLWISVTKEDAAMVVGGDLCVAETHGKFGKGVYFDNRPQSGDEDFPIVLEFETTHGALIINMDDEEDPLTITFKSHGYERYVGKPAFLKLAEKEHIDGLRDDEQTCVLNHEAVRFSKVYHGVIDDPLVDVEQRELDEVALGGLQRCTAVTLDAILSHFARLGITIGDVPETGEGVLNILSSRGLAYKPDPLAAGKTVGQFANQHHTGVWYLVSPGHAMALVDGELFDAEHKGPDGRKLVSAMEILRR